MEDTHNRHLLQLWFVGILEGPHLAPVNFDVVDLLEEGAVIIYGYEILRETIVKFEVLPGLLHWFVRPAHVSITSVPSPQGVQCGLGVLVVTLI